jgi:hypothetical protein
MSRDGERSRRYDGRAGGEGVRDGAEGLAPGKRTLTQNLVQRRVPAGPADDGATRRQARAPYAEQSRTAAEPREVVSGGLAETFGPLAGRSVQLIGQPTGGEEDIHAAAAVGVQGPGSDIPHLGELQAAFGGHDLSAIRARVGGDAAAACDDIGATAYATGNDVAFSGPPDLHTAAHEAAHVVQQRAGVHLKGGVGETGDAYEREADAVADRVVAGESAAPLLARYEPLISAQQSPLVQRQAGAKSLDRDRYDAIEARLKTLLAQKRAAVEGNGNMEAADAEIDALVAALHADFGVRLDKGKILEAAAADKDMLVVNGRVHVSPSGGEHYMGERLGFIVEIDHVPPGEGLQIGWRWRPDPWGGPEYRFLVSGPAFAEKTTSLDMELDTPFWGLVPPAIEKAKGIQVAAQVYIGRGDRPTTTLYSHYISLPERPVGGITIVGAPARAILGQYVDLGIGPWTPDFHGHSIDWFVDDRKVAGDQLGLRHQLTALGAHRVRADVHAVRRSFGAHDKTPLTSAEATIEIVTADQFGTSFLDESEASPARPKPVALGKMVASGEDTVDEMQDRVQQGGSQQPHWEARLKGQKERVGKLKEFAPDYATAKPLPDDPTTLEAGAYNGPITAALVMAQNGGAQPLILHLTIRGQGGAWTTRLIDSTSRKVLRYDGAGATPLEAYESAFETWLANNEYPTGGRIVHRFEPKGWSKGHGFDTYTTWKRAKEWVDGIITVGGFVVGALLLADPDPTISKLLGGILMAAVVARSSVAIYERIRDGGDVLSSENILDGVAIVTSFMGLSGTVLRAAGLTARNPMVYRAGNWIIMGALAGDVGTLVYVGAEALAQMQAIQGDPTLDDGQKASETLRIMASLFVTGAMLIASNKELLRNGLKPTDFIQGKVERGVKPDLDVGARLDAEYELKQAGKWTNETSKLPDEAVLDTVFAHRSRQEIEPSLATQIGEKPAADLANGLGDKAFVALHGALGEPKLAAVAKEFDLRLFKAMPLEDAAKLKVLGGLQPGELEALLAKVAACSSESQTALWSLDVPTVKRITEYLSGPELDALAHVGADGVRKLGRLHSFNLRNLATLTPADLAALVKLDAARIEKLSALGGHELGKAAPFDQLTVDAKLSSVAATESRIDAELSDPDTRAHLRENDFVRHGAKENEGGKRLKLSTAGRKSSVPIESPEFVVLEGVPPLGGGAAPTITKVDVTGLEVGTTTQITGELPEAQISKSKNRWEVPIPGSPHPTVTIEGSGGTARYDDPDRPPLGLRVQVDPSTIAQKGFSGGHTRATWNEATTTYADLLAGTPKETGAKFTLPGKPDPVTITKIDYVVKLKSGATKPVKYPKTIFENAAQLDAVEAYAKPYIAAAWETRPMPATGDDVLDVAIPVKTLTGQDAVLTIQVPRQASDSGGPPEVNTWFPHPNNFTKGGAFNP